MVKPVVFIQSNAKQLIGAKVAEHALKRNSKSPDAFNVQIMRLEDYPVLYNRSGQSYLRNGRKAIWNKDDLQTFTPLRFLPPTLMDFNGKAIVIDPDVFALGDVMELFEKNMEGKSVFCRKIIPDDSREPYWATSVMLLDCSQLIHWNWERCINEMFEFKRDYREWMSLKLESTHNIGTLADEWNHYDILNESTKMLHNTGRITQPWKTGLPIDFSTDKQDYKSFSKRVKRFARAIFNSSKKYADVTGNSNNMIYLPHPDPRQEQLFFKLLNECVQDKKILEKELTEAIELGYVRRDAFERMEANI